MWLVVRVHPALRAQNVGGLRAVVEPHGDQPVAMGRVGSVTQWDQEPT